MTREIYTNEKFIVPVDYLTIKAAQDVDGKLNEMKNKDTEGQDFKTMTFGQTDLTVKQGNNEQWRIFIPEPLCQDLISWYH